MEANKLNHEIQYGFTKGGRVEHCMFTLNHITNMTYESRRKEHRNLYFAMIDFRKAYYSVDRWSLIKAMRNIKINTDIIDIIVQMYTGDTTTICLGGKEEKVEVTSGIRQGCSISTLLFKLITYNIIEELEEKGEMYEVADYKGNSIWLADDTTLIANSKVNLEKNIDILKKAALKYGLEVNTKKSKIIRIRGKENYEEIAGCDIYLFI